MESCVNLEGLISFSVLEKYVSGWSQNKSDNLDYVTNVINDRETSVSLNLLQSTQDHYDFVYIADQTPIVRQYFNDRNAFCRESCST